MFGYVIVDTKINLQIKLTHYKFCFSWIEKNKNEIHTRYYFVRRN